MKKLLLALIFVGVILVIVAPILVFADGTIGATLQPQVATKVTCACDAKGISMFLGEAPGETVVKYQNVPKGPCHRNGGTLYKTLVSLDLLSNEVRAICGVSLPFQKLLYPAEAFHKRWLGSTDMDLRAYNNDLKATAQQLCDEYKYDGQVIPAVATVGDSVQPVTEFGLGANPIATVDYAK